MKGSRARNEHDAAFTVRFRAERRRSSIIRRWGSSRLTDNASSWKTVDGRKTFDETRSRWLEVGDTVESIRFPEISAIHHMVIITLRTRNLDRRPPRCDALPLYRIVNEPMRFKPTTVRYRAEVGWEKSFHRNRQTFRNRGEHFTYYNIIAVVG